MSRITWDEYFMYIAKITALRSKDPHTKVGAVIVSKDNKVMSIGYNGAPRNFDDNKVPWNRDNTLPYTEQKYAYMCHAEMNAVVNYGGSMKDFKDSTVYVTLFPCNDCAKLLSQIGVSRIVYLEDTHHGEPIYEASRIILAECKIPYEQFKETSGIHIDINVN